jgi:hypothetical protein
VKPILSQFHCSLFPSILPSDHKVSVISPSALERSSFCLKHVLKTKQHRFGVIALIGSIFFHITLNRPHLSATKLERDNGYEINLAQRMFFPDPELTVSVAIGWTKLRVIWLEKPNTELKIYILTRLGQWFLLCLIFRTKVKPKYERREFSRKNPSGRQTLFRETEI